MPRAKRFFLPGFIYHITHRCHDRAFLLKLTYEKGRWMSWISRAIDKYGLKVLGYCITDNHIHLIAHPEDSRVVIAKTMHLVAGRVGQEYNERKNRRGAFWEDRYHATAIQSRDHLLRCMVYVDLNMVRAGVVDHPAKWDFCGFSEMAKPEESATIIDRACLLESTGLNDWDEFSARYRDEIDRALTADALIRDDRWTRSIAVGDRDFVDNIRGQLAHRARHREVEGGADEVFVLRELRAAYGNDLSTGEHADWCDNLVPWEDDAP